MNKLITILLFSIAIISNGKEVILYPKQKLGSEWWGYVDQRVGNKTTISCGKTVW